MRRRASAWASRTLYWLTTPESRMKRNVAIKVLPEYWSRDPERLRRFEQEAQALPSYLLADFVSVVASSGFFHNSP